MSEDGFATEDLPQFDRRALELRTPFSRIGTGRLGGKAQGLAFIRGTIESRLGGDAFPGITIDIPPLAVVATDVFDAFMEHNGLYEIAHAEHPDDEIANAFQQAHLPEEIVVDLEALIDQVHTPLAVRSSSLLEDDRFEPFAGVYQTKMIPNNQPNRAARLRRLVEAIKFVYASTYFKAAKNYIRATEKVVRTEKMAVIIQKAVGHQHNSRFYPQVSGVGRSFNFYPMGTGKPQEGVINLVLGLGKTIMDGDLAWSYSPVRPLAPPPFASPHDRLKGTQTTFWAVRMSPPAQPDPIAETEFLVKDGLEAAERDGTLTYLASTYDGEYNRLSPGTTSAGPRVVDFAPLLVLEEYPLNNAVKTLLTICEEHVGSPVEIEFAATFPEPGTDARARLAVLQVRPMAVSHERVDVADEELTRPNVLVASEYVMGNGALDKLQDVIYVKPDTFETLHTRAMATQLDVLNTRLMVEGRRYVLLGFGRWGTSDPWLGIPVKWGQICGAKVVIEATRPGMVVEPSQGSHFFHNITSFRVSYFYVHHGLKPGIDWAWLDAQPAHSETEFLRHVRLDAPLQVKVDGRTGRGAIWHRG
jgi:hypothetical protein